MKIIVSADWHLSEKNRFSDVCKTLESIAKYCSWSKADYFFFLGDAYDYAGPTNKERSVIHKLFTEIRAYGTKIITIPGNHDIAKADLTGEFSSTAEYINLNVPDVKVFSYPGGAVVDNNVLFAFIPHIPKACHDGMSYAEHYAQLLKKIDQDNPGPYELKVLLSHVMVQEAAPVDAEKHPDILNRSIPLSLLNNSGYNIVLLGDVHKNMILNDDPYIAYAGSPDRISFNEIADHKGFYEINITDQVEIEFKSLNVRKFVGSIVTYSDEKFSIHNLVSGSHPESSHTVGSVQELKEYLSSFADYKDSIVSFSLHAPSNVIKEITQDEIKQCISAASACSVKLCKFIITDSVSSRDKKFTKSLDQNAALELWAASKQYAEPFKSAFIAKGSEIMGSSK